MGKFYEREIVIYVWRFAGLKNIKRTGHAAIKLKAPEFYNSANKKHQCYISWWPKDDVAMKQAFGKRSPEVHLTYNQDRVRGLAYDTRVKLANGSFQPVGNQKYSSALYTPSDTGEVLEAQSNPNAWGVSADAKVYLPAAGCHDAFYGLDIVKMRRWWEVFSKSSYGYFKINDVNCSKVTAMCLLAGGAARFAKPPYRSWRFWEPNTILKWAQAIESKLKTLNSELTDIQVIANRAFNSKEPNLLDVDVWKNATKTSNFNLRRGQTGAIDKLLVEYRAVANAATIEALTKQTEILDQILAYAHDHISAKGDKSKRSEVMVTLASQVIRAHKAANRLLNTKLTEKAQNLSGKQKYEILDIANNLQPIAPGVDESWL